MHRRVFNALARVRRVVVVALSQVLPSPQTHPARRQSMILANPSVPAPVIFDIVIKKHNIAAADVAGMVKRHTMPKQRAVRRS